MFENRLKKMNLLLTPNIIMRLAKNIHINAPGFQIGEKLFACNKCDKYQRLRRTGELLIQLFIVTYIQ